MSTSTPSRSGASLARLAPQFALLLIASAGAWLWAVLHARHMGDVTGTMGLGPGPFAVIWTMMMTAMMLPSAAPFAATYARTFYSRRQLRMGAFAAGYLLVWALSSIPAFGIAWLAGAAAERSGAMATVFAVGVFSACGVYQLTPVKYRCLAHCRTPLAHLFQFASYSGPLRDVRVGVEHGYFCIACCWALMLLMAAFGVMNLAVMVVLAAVIAVEKLWSRGPAFARVTGVASLVLAVLVIWVPGLAPGLREPVVGLMDGM